MSDKPPCDHRWRFINSMDAFVCLLCHTVERGD